MAREIIVKVTLDTKDVDVGAQKIKRAVENAIAPSTDHIRRLTSATSGLSSALGALAGVAAFKQIAQFGIDLDRSRNAMTALTGSVEKANAKLAELRALAKASPGVTTTFATQLFQQLKAVGNITDETINKVIKSLGKLNTVFGDVGPEFARNLIQIFQQGFERSDIKEALGRVPIFEQLLEKAFGTKDPEKLRKLKESGKLTLGGFLSGFAEGIDTDPRFKNIQESLGGKLAKQFEETKIKLAELGERMLRDLIPILDKLLPIANSILDVLNKLPDGLKAATIGLIAFAPALSGVTNAIIGLRGAIVALGGFLTTPAGIAALALVGVGTAVVGFQNMTENIDAQVRARLKSMSRNIDNPDSDVVIGDPAATAAARAMSSSAIRGQLNMFLKPGAPPPPPPGGGGSGRGTRRRDETAAEVAEMIRKIDEGREEFGRNLVRSLEDIDKALRDGIIENEKNRLVNQREVRKRLTQEFEAREALLARQAETLLRTSRRGLTRSGALVEDALNRGQLTGGEAELLRQGAAGDFANKLREVLAIKEKMVGVDKAVLDDLRDEIELYDRLGTTISDTERFMRGFNSQIESSGDAFERFGANVSRAFGNVRDLFNGLKSAVLGFFNDLLGNSIQNLVRGVLGPIFSGRGGGGGGGIGGFFQQAFAGAGGGGGISAPPSVSGGGGLLSSIGSFFSGGGGSPAGLDRLMSDPFAATQFGLSLGGGGGAAGAARGGFGFNFGQFGQSLANAAPLLGLSIGASLGGKSIGGNILGAAGGLLTSTFISTTLGAPGALGSLAPALFSNPITAIAGAALLVGAVFAGRASQRRKDEEASGEMLGQAIQAIEQLKAGIASGQIEGSQARSIFENQILAQFIQQINTLKTASVRKSRLTNQVRDLRNMYEAIITPEIAAQIQRRQTAASNALTHSRLIPEFATGGTSMGGLAILHPGEKILNFRQQAAIRSMAGPNAFERAGVPSFDRGGTFGGAPRGQEQPIEINLQAQVMIGKGDATRIVVVGGSTTTGRQVTVNNVKAARLNREL